MHVIDLKYDMSQTHPKYTAKMSLFSLLAKPLDFNDANPFFLPLYTQMLHGGKKMTSITLI